MSRHIELVAVDPEATRAIGAVIADLLEPGDVVSLTGELGAGKTCLVQGVAAGLGVGERVTSPTFLLRRDYEGRIPLTHLDVYRLETLGEVLDLGFGEEEGAVVVEWGDAMQPLLPADHLEVELVLADPAAEPTGGAEPRLLRLRPSGDGWRRRLAAAEERLSDWRGVAQR